MANKKQWVGDLFQIRYRTEVVVAETEEEAKAALERLADKASDEVWSEPPWQVSERTIKAYENSSSEIDRAIGGANG